MGEITKMQEHLMRKSLAYKSKFAYNGGLSRLPQSTKNYKLEQYKRHDYPRLLGI